ncbi:methylenetetrahydrofolate reduct [Laetiporus sulphureus 93-53]|uniref:Methylenetetrahydrofolate reduct n=1 Tax=Laetiporus sulphureus 93-53 TaxID=1314785 RepID=A0A165FZ12_9APHY|nr:methylenetetrahydrofolate reduct [Laetiporus sulphureus 93-53]KZT09600.1 methylenetetrahydrofolate reduct [Laetiporus sulphureus 93-53]
MKLNQKIAEYREIHPFFTFEFFPPKTDQGFDNLLSRISRLVSLNPLAVSITWGAGGSTKDRSLELAGLTQSEHGVDTILHLTCTNMKQGMVDEALRDAKARGIQSILALRGDPPRGEEYWISTDPRFNHGADLVSYIKSSPEFSSDFCIGVAVYPDGHPDRGTDEEGELEHLKQKVNAGADFIITQLFYDVDGFLQWVKKVRQKGIQIPIIPGIMPIQTYASFLRMTKLCGTRVPPSLMSDIVPLRHDDQKVKDYGVGLAIKMIRQLTADGDIRGVHFCTLNLEKSVTRVLEGLGWAGGSPKPANKLIADDVAGPGSELVVTPHNATDTAAKELAVSSPGPDGEAGKGELNNAASWDDFPNGRFGDFKSPAYGETDLWGSSIMSHKQAIKQWGDPTTLDDLTTMFLRYLHSKIATTPFSPSPLSPESLMIIHHLERLTRKGWWTVGSQPAINGASSSDEVVGWGPRGGYVYQKCFVEFFVEGADLEKIERKVKEHGHGWVDYYAGNVQGECHTTVPEGGRNAVTWGVFPGQEIAQTTIIEKESFLAWKDEAFSIWAEWASFYPPDSHERTQLESIRNERWLVSIIHHDYMDPSSLWNFLFKDDPLV